jgi:hypothetical protein
LKSSLHNYAHIVHEWNGPDAVGPAILSLGAEAGMPAEKFREILQQVFGE